MMEVLDHECMQAVGLVADITAWKQKETRYNTKKSYTVNKWVEQPDVSDNHEPTKMFYI